MHVQKVLNNQSINVILMQYIKGIARRMDALEYYILMGKRCVWSTSDTFVLPMKFCDSLCYISLWEGTYTKLYSSMIVSFILSLEQLCSLNTPFLQNCMKMLEIFPLKRCLHTITSACHGMHT